MGLFLNGSNGAELSDCRKYRFRLWRIWDDRKEALIFIGLNPSTADENSDDPTIRWLRGYAQKQGCGGLVVVNLFAFRATDPKGMIAEANPIQPPGMKDNDDSIILSARKSALVLCGWGRYGTHLGRDQKVLRMLNRNGVAPRAIALNRDGTPSHPLRKSHSLRPFLL